MDLVAEVNRWQGGVALRDSKTDKAKEQWYNSECKHHVGFDQQKIQRYPGVLFRGKSRSIYIDLSSLPFLLSRAGAACC